MAPRSDDAQGTTTSPRDVVALAGANLISAVGSLPLHLLPVVTATLMAGGRASAVQAGGVASSLLLGQLASSLALPAVGIGTISRSAVVALGCALAAGLFVSGLSGVGALYAGWCVVGLCCGVLQYLGVVTAAAYRDPRLAFVLRLGIVLTLAGAVVGALRLAGTLVSYHGLMVLLCTVFGLLLAIGAALFRPEYMVPADGWGSSLRPRDAPGLAAVFVLFVGQTGFLVHVVQRAIDRGMLSGEVIWAFSAIKVAAGLALLALLLRHRGDQEPRFLILGLVLAACIAVVSATTDVVVFFVGLLAFEIGFNTLSARLQARVVMVSRVGRWLTGAILLGAALGPPLHGWALGVGSGSDFIAFAVASALVPWAWEFFFNRRRGHGA